MRETRVLTVALVFSIAVLAGACYFGNRFLQSSAEERAALERTDALIFDLDQTLSTMKDIETGQRGYLLTGRSSYLEPYNAGLGRIQQQLAHLRTEVAGQPAQAARLTAAQGAIAKKLGELAETVRLQRAGQHQAARSIVITDAGKQDMDKIRTLFAQMQDDERNRLGALAAPVRARYRTLYVLIDGFPAVAVVLLGLVYSLARRDSRRERMAAERIHRNEQELQLIVDHVPGLVSYIDKDLRYIRVNATYESWLGRPASEIVGHSVREVVGEQRYQLVEPHLRKAMSGSAEQYTYETTGKYNSVEKRLRVGYSVDRDPSGQVIGAVFLATDVTPLWEAQENLRRLTYRLMRVQDEEQRRLARELHDGTAQDVAALVLLLDRTYHAIAPGHVNPCDSALVRSDIQEAMKLSEQSLRALRSVSYLLHPPLLDELGLASALEWLVSGFQERSGIEVQLDTPGDLIRLAPEIELAAFRVVQESLSNALRHSGATEVRIAVEVGGALELTVQDNGKGLSLASSEKSATGVGIPGMRERVEALGGSVRILSDHGVTVSASLPVENREMAA